MESVAKKRLKHILRIQFGVKRLREITSVFLQLKGKTAQNVFGSWDGNGSSFMYDAFLTQSCRVICFNK